MPEAAPPDAKRPSWQSGILVEKRQVDRLDACLEGPALKSGVDEERALQSGQGDAIDGSNRSGQRCANGQEEEKPGIAHAIVRQVGRAPAGTLRVYIDVINNVSALYLEAVSKYSPVMAGRRP